MRCANEGQKDKKDDVRSVRFFMLSEKLSSGRKLLL